MPKEATIIDLEGLRAHGSEVCLKRDQCYGPYQSVRIVAAGGFDDLYERVHQLPQRNVASPLDGALPLQWAHKEGAGG